MKPIELYNREPEKNDKELGYLKGCYYNHVPEIEDELWGLDNEKIEVKYYKEHHFDGRRVWRLASVWFDGKPVMIIQNAGREGDDHDKRFITDENLYIKMINYIRSLIPMEKIGGVFDPNDDIEKLDEFYNYKLDGHFDIWQ